MSYAYTYIVSISLFSTDLPSLKTISLFVCLFVCDRPALVVDHPDRQVTGVDAQVEGDAPHHDQPQFQAWARNYHSYL